MARAKKSTPPKGLTDLEHEQMFQMYVQKIPLQKIGKAFTVSRNTVDRIRRDNGWNARREKVLRKAHAKADDRAAYKLVEELMAVNVLSKSLLPKISLLIKVMERKLAKLAANDEQELQAWGYERTQDALLALKKEYRELVKLKTELVDRVDPELPQEPEVDTVGEALKKLSSQNITLLAEEAAAQLARNAPKKKS